MNILKCKKVKQFVQDHIVIMGTERGTVRRKDPFSSDWNWENILQLSQANDKDKLAWLQLSPSCPFHLYQSPKLCVTFRKESELAQSNATLYWVTQALSRRGKATCPWMSFLTVLFACTWFKSFSIWLYIKSNWKKKKALKIGQAGQSCLEHPLPFFVTCNINHFNLFFQRGAMI